MKLVDVNVLLYATVPTLVHHRRSHRWLRGALEGAEPVGLPWHTVLGFVRIVSNPRAVLAPLAVSDALDLVEIWLSSPVAVTPEPDLRHLTRVRALLEGTGGGTSSLVPDAHLAALAIQCSATLVTFDSDVGRFPGLRWESPA